MIRNKSPTSCDRVYLFDCVTYLTEDELKRNLCENESRIKRFAYILHDLDEDKETHFHLLLHTFTNHTARAVARWFYGYDSKGQGANTFVQPMINRLSSFDYLTHKGFDDKAQYLEGDIVTNDFAFWSGDDDESDTMTQAVEDFFSGVPYYELAKRYGRDFIIHFSSFKYLVDTIMKEELRNVNSNE